VRCHIVRKPGKGFISGTAYPEYFLYLDGPRDKPGNPTMDTTDFLLSARKRKKSKSSNYIISLSEDDLARQSDSFFGKVRSNFVGTAFTIFDNGGKPGARVSDSGKSQPAPRMGLGSVTYEYNVLGTRGPRKMTAAIPTVDGSGQRLGFHPVSADSEEIIGQLRNCLTAEMLVLRNKPPRWSEQRQAYSLNFSGRVTHASVKNFQLVHEQDLDGVVLQFGKVGKDMFTMDFRYPMSAFQAFAICLTSFDSKLACE
jgi:tubby-related protein 1